MHNKYEDQLLDWFLWMLSTNICKNLK